MTSDASKGAYLRKRECSFDGCKGQSTVYFIAWPVQNLTRQLLLLISSEVGQHLFEANINGAVAFYELKMKFKL